MNEGFLIFGISMFVGALLGTVLFLQCLRESEYCDWIIKYFVTINDHEGSSKYPIVEYQDSSGAMRSFRSNMNSDLQGWEIGDVLKVRVFRGKPYLHFPYIEAFALGTFGLCGLVSIVKAFVPWF